MSEHTTPRDALLDVLVYAPAGLVLTLVEELPELAVKGRRRIEGRVTTARVVGQFAVQFARQQVSQRRSGGWAGGVSGMGGAPAPAAHTGAPRTGGSGSAEPNPAWADPDLAPVTEMSRPGATGARSSRRAVAPPLAAAGPRGSAPRRQAEAASSSKRASGTRRTGVPASPGRPVKAEAASSSKRASGTRRTGVPASPGRPAKTGSSGSAALSVMAPTAGSGSRPGGGGPGGGGPGGGGVQAVTAAPAAGDGGALGIPGYDSLSASQVVQRLAGLTPAELRGVRQYETLGRHRRTILNRVDQILGGTVPGAARAGGADVPPPASDGPASVTSAVGDPGRDAGPPARAPIGR